MDCDIDFVYEVWNEFWITCCSVQALLTPFETTKGITSLYSESETEDLLKLFLVYTR